MYKITKEIQNLETKAEWPIRARFSRDKNTNGDILKGKAKFIKGYILYKGQCKLIL